jgi:hypothetical protein
MLDYGFLTLLERLPNRDLSLFTIAWDVLIIFQSRQINEAINLAKTCKVLKVGFVRSCNDQFKKLQQLSNDRRG